MDILLSTQIIATDKLLPRLESLTIHIQTSEQLTYGLLFLTKSFNGTLVLSAGRTHPGFAAMTAFANLAAHRAPNLKSLDSHVPITYIARQWLPSLKGLRSLALPSLHFDLSFLVTLSNLPVLDELNLRFMVSEIIPGSPIASDSAQTHGRFKMLTRISIEGSQATYVLKLFPQGQIQSIKLVVAYVKETCQRDLKDLCNSVLRIGQHSLTSIRIVNHSTTTCTLGDLSTLTECLELQELEIHHLGRLSMDDQQVGKFTERLKKLQTIAIRGIKTESS